MTIEEKINEIISLEHQKEELEAKQDVLKAEVMAEMDQNGLKKVSTNEADVTKANKVTYSYTDEAAIMDYIKSNGLDNYLEVKIRKTDFNKELSKKGSLYESLSGKFSTSETPYLKIKEKATI